MYIFICLFVCMCLRIHKTAYFQASIFLIVSARSYLSVQSEKPQAAQRKTRVKPSCQGNLTNFPNFPTVFVSKLQNILPKPPCCICIQASELFPQIFSMNLNPSIRTPSPATMLYLYSSLDNIAASLFENNWLSRQNSSR